MASNPVWTRQELLVAFRLYCRTPFGKQHKSNPDVIALANLIGRTPSAVAMKLNNFSSLDPAEQARGIAGLKKAGRGAEELWAEFEADSESVAWETEQAFDLLSRTEREAAPRPYDLTGVATETVREVKVRSVQQFFRAAVLASYGGRCALTGLECAGLLIASHIVPWAVSHQLRADPRNGLCLNAFHDRAFDRGYITFDTDLRLVLSREIAEAIDLGETNKWFVNLAGTMLRVPKRFRPSAECLAYHRNEVFLGS